MLAALALFVITPQIAWRTDLDAALAEAGRSGKPVAVLFVEPGDEKTEAFVQRTLSQPQVAELYGRSVPVRVEAREEGQVLAKAYQVRELPATVLVSAEDALVARIEGAAGPRRFGFEMERAYRAFDMSSRGTTDSAELALCCALKGEIGRAKEHLSAAEASKAKRLWPAYAAVGDFHLGQREFQAAIPVYEKALKVAAEPVERSYAHVRIIICAREVQDEDRALASVEALLEDPKTPEPDRQYAQRIYRYMRQVRSSNLTPR